MNKCSRILLSIASRYCTAITWVTWLLYMIAEASAAAAAAAVLFLRAEKQQLTRVSVRCRRAVASFGNNNRSFLPDAPKHCLFEGGVRKHMMDPSISLQVE